MTHSHPTPLRQSFNNWANLAKIGIGLPHNGHAHILMAAGKKPCLITQWPLQDFDQEKYTKLQPFVDSGQIVLIGVKELEFPTHIICHPDAAEAARTQIPILQKKHSRMPLNQQEWQAEEAFLRDYCMISVRDKDGRFVPDEINKRNRNESPEECQLLLEGKIKATLPVMTGENFGNAPPEILQKITSGELTSVNVRTEIKGMAVLAQRDCREMGKELFARYYNQREGYSFLSKDDHTKRIGALLGYTEADTAFFLKERTGSLIDRLKSKYSDAIRAARAEWLLANPPSWETSPNSPTNPASAGAGNSAPRLHGVG